MSSASPPPPPPLSRHHLSHTTLSHTIFIHLSHTSLSHAIFLTPSLSHAQLCHTPSFTHHLCHTPSLTHTHTSLSHTIFHTPSLSDTIFHTPSLSHPSLSHQSFTHHLYTPSFSHHLCHAQLCHIHPNAKVLATFAFDSYSQSKRSPRPLSRHRPCKTPFPIGNATFNKLLRFCLKWVFLINSQWNAGFIQPFLPRTAGSVSSRSHCYSGARKSHQLCSHFLFCMELRPPQARKRSQPKKKIQQQAAKTSSSCHSGSRKNLARVRTVLLKHQFTT